MDPRGAREHGPGDPLPGAGIAPEAEPEWPVGKVGYVAILGRPNVGKSTFLNAVVGQRLAAVSAKPQTTRRRWLGIRSDACSQMLFFDTPGVHTPCDAMGEAMQRAVMGSLRDADLVLCMADPTRPPGDEDRQVASIAAACNQPRILVLNKCDAASGEEAQATARFFSAELGDAPTFHVSALRGNGLPELLEAIRAALPRGPFLYSPDTTTDAFERQIGAELIREAMLEVLHDELPHASAVVIESWDEGPHRRDIRAVLYVERDSQKGIVIGRNGRMLRRIRERSEPKLADLCGCNVRLRLWVKVARDWRRREGSLRQMEQTPRGRGG